MHSLHGIYMGCNKVLQTEFSEIFEDSKKLLSDSSYRVLGPLIV